ncbi:MAG: hypothetical protein NC483_04115, partial [Ruminococcus sp.]|nr:hypothetical protein [Ruminococcus sp.]
GNHSFSGIGHSYKCNLSLNKPLASNYNTMEELLDNYYIYKKVRTSKNKDFNVQFGETTEKTVFVAPDDYSYSYYFAGNPLDNWVEFGGYYWRIIRVNGDGSIRMIYQGRTQDENGNKLEPQTTGEETQIGKSAFNSIRSDNKYVGFQYEQGEIHGLYNSNNPNTGVSTIYTYLNDWYENISTLTAKDKAKIDQDAAFCGDRTVYSDRNGNAATTTSGIGKTLTYYGSYVRLFPSGSVPTSSSTAVKPTLKCADNSDLYTYSEANSGNKKLKNPVGLISADEAAYTGMVRLQGARPEVMNYLYTNTSYWTLSPSDFTASIAVLMIIHTYGGISYGGSDVERGVRPVINLRSDVEFTGDGTMSNPFKVI